MDFTEQQIQRYSRHILLQSIGVEGQQLIREGKVLIAGAGGLGSAVALYLAAAGVGTLGIVDHDVVDMTNLQRQVIHFTPDIGKSKVLSAREKINQLNPDVTVIPYHELVTAGNIMNIIRDYDFIVDATDNFPVKFLINDACVIAGKPFSHGSILRFEGQTMTYIPGNACYRCVFRNPPPPGIAPGCSQAGILGSIAGMLGTIQATETLKFLTGTGKLLTNRLLFLEALNMDFRTAKFGPDDDCPVCGRHKIITQFTNYEQTICDLHEKQAADFQNIVR